MSRVEPIMSSSTMKSITPKKESQNDKSVSKKKQKTSEYSWFRELDTEETDGELSMQIMYIEGTDNPNTQVCLSETDKFPDLQVSGDKRLSCSIKHLGHSMIRATHCVERGSYFFEVKIEEPSLKEAHYRIGWARRPGKVSYPCGSDRFSYSYRDVEGDVFHDADGKPYGSPYKVGDVVGCFIHLTGYDFSSVKPEEETWTERGVKCRLLRHPVAMVTSTGSFIKYFVNGVDQGVAFQDILGGRYYPAISLYMGASVTFEFANFKYPPKDEFQKIE